MIVLICILSVFVRACLHLYNETYRHGFVYYEYANIVAGFTQSITQWNGDGELTVKANNRYEDGVRGYYFKQHCYFAKDDKQYLIRSIDANTILSGTYVFPSEIIGLNGEADTGIQLLKEFLEE